MFSMLLNLDVSFLSPLSFALVFVNLFFIRPYDFNDILEKNVNKCI